MYINEITTSKFPPATALLRSVRLEQKQNNAGGY